MTKSKSLTILLLLLLATPAFAQLPLRGRVVRWCGPFGGSRQVIRWGNGISDNAVSLGGIAGEVFTNSDFLRLLQLLAAQQGTTPDTEGGNSSFDAASAGSDCYQKYQNCLAQSQALFNNRPSSVQKNGPAAVQKTNKPSSLQKTQKAANSPVQKDALPEPKTPGGGSSFDAASAGGSVAGGDAAAEPNLDQRMEAAVARAIAKSLGNRLKNIEERLEKLEGEKQKPAVAPATPAAKAKEAAEPKTGG